MWTWIQSLGQDIQRGLVTYILVGAGAGAWLLSKLKVAGGVLYDLATLKIGISLVLLLCALFYLLGRKIEKSNWKKDKKTIKIEEFELQPEGYYTNPEYEYDAICPKCLHFKPPKVVPMTQASGPWKCVSCDAKISPKAACVSLPPPSRRENWVTGWRGWV